MERENKGKNQERIKLEKGRNFFDQEPFTRAIANSQERAPDLPIANLREMVSFIGGQLRLKTRLPYVTVLTKASTFKEIDPKKLADESLRTAWDLVGEPYWFEYVIQAKRAKYRVTGEWLDIDSMSPAVLYSVWKNDLTSPVGYTIVEHNGGMKVIYSKLNFS